jgi:uncharacterized protein YecT (DUF1311 family)
MRLQGLAVAAGGLALVCLSAGAAAEQSEPRRSAQLDDCLAHVVDNEHGSRWPAVIICYEDDFSAQDRRLQAAYQTLDTAARRLGPRALDEITSSRRQWTLYRDGWCAFEQEQFVAPNADIARLSCRIDVTRAQLARVSEQIAVLR